MLVGVSIKNKVAECHCGVDDQHGVMRRRFILPDVPVTHFVAETGQAADNADEPAELLPKTIRNFGVLG